MCVLQSRYIREKDVNDANGVMCNLANLSRYIK